MEKPHALDNDSKLNAGRPYLIALFALILTGVAASRGLGEPAENNALDGDVNGGNNDCAWPEWF